MGAKNTVNVGGGDALSANGNIKTGGGDGLDAKNTVKTEPEQKPLKIHGFFVNGVQQKWPREFILGDSTLAPPVAPLASLCFFTQQNTAKYLPM